MKIGLKLFSSDIDLLPEADSLKHSTFDFVELYIVPGTYRETINHWKRLSVPFAVHAPHAVHGVNFARAEKWQENQRCFREVSDFARDLASDIIIVHGGNNGPFQETLRQLQLLNETRLVLENKPKLGLGGELCVGWTPSELRMALDSGAVSGIALDFVHASCASVSAGRSCSGIIKEFLELHPRIFHLADGDAASEKDRHLNLGKGNCDLKHYVECIPLQGRVTLETPRNPPGSLQDFIRDVDYLDRLIGMKEFEPKVS